MVKILLYVHTLHFFYFKEVISMKEIIKSAMFIGIGIGATYAYQKYSKPMMKEIEKFTNKTMKKVNKELEEMM